MRVFDSGAWATAMGNRASRSPHRAPNSSYLRGKNPRLSPKLLDCAHFHRQESCISDLLQNTSCTRNDYDCLCSHRLVSNDIDYCFESHCTPSVEDFLSMISISYHDSTSRWRLALCPIRLTSLIRRAKHYQNRLWIRRPHTTTGNQGDLDYIRSRGVSMCGAEIAGKNRQTTNMARADR